ncbi:hypothetical protein BJ170DRAFT_712920 [Xylariales sp. AK1849]|nr:hypothetical protein BJ170DRAFT_712920 [Xylariales sp. AK1849]
MNFLLLLAAAMMACAHVFDLSAREESDFLPATWGNITWRGNITEAGPVMNFTGTSLQDIEHKISQRERGFVWNTTWFATSRQIDEHKKRDHSDFICNVGGQGYAGEPYILEGVEYLQNIPGGCHQEPGPQVCSRVSCSYNAAIWCCNDNDHDIWVPCHTLGDYAFEIRQKCMTMVHQDADSRWTVQGQWFDSENWNVIVGRDDC